MRIAPFVLTAVLCVPNLYAQKAAPSSVDARIATQNALFEEQWQATLRNNPERATAIGDYRYNDKLADYSLARIQQQNADNKAYLARLSAIDVTGFPEQDILSHQLMERSLKVTLENYAMSVNQQNGIHSDLLDSRTDLWIEAQLHSTTASN